MRKCGLPLIGVTALLLISLPASAADQPSTEPTSPPVAEVVHGWPGARAAPAGLYSWTVAPTSGFSRYNWMHKIPKGYAGDCCAEVALTFYGGTPSSDLPEIEAFESIYGWREHAPFDRPKRVGSRGSSM